MIPTSIIIHHTASGRDTTDVHAVNLWHKARDFNLSSLGYYVGYHFLITADGKITQTRKENEIGCHCVPNDGKIGICCTGNFDLEMPTPAQLTSLEQCLTKLKADYGFKDTDIFCHYEKSRTACPGKNLIEWVKAYRQLSFLQQLLQKLLALLKVAR